MAWLISVIVQVLGLVQVWLLEGIHHLNKMVKRRLHDVNVEVTADKRVIITGGCLKSGLAWVVPQSDCDEIGEARDMFIRLSSVDHGLYTLCGVKLENNGFLEELKDLRTQASKAAVDEIVEKNVDLKRATKTRRKEKYAEFMEKHSDKLPLIVSVPYPESPKGGIQFKYEKNNKKAVSIPLDADLLAFMAKKIRLTVDGGTKNRKRKKSQLYDFIYQEVRMGAKGPPYVRYRNEDGMWKYKSYPFDVKPHEDRDKVLAELAEKLHIFYTENHHGDDEDDDADDEDIHGDMDDEHGDSAACCDEESSSPEAKHAPIAQLEPPETDDGCIRVALDRRLTEGSTA